MNNAIEQRSTNQEAPFLLTNLPETPHSEVIKGYSIDADGWMYVQAGEKAGTHGEGEHTIVIENQIDFYLNPQDFSLPPEGTTRQKQLQNHLASFGRIPPKSEKELPDFLYNLLTKNGTITLEFNAIHAMSTRTPEQYEAFIDGVISAQRTEDGLAKKKGARYEKKQYLPENPSGCCDFTHPDPNEGVAHFHTDFQHNNKGEILTTLALLGEKRAIKTIEALILSYTDQNIPADIIPIRRLRGNDLILTLSSVIIDRRKDEPKEKVTYSNEQRYTEFANQVLLFSSGDVPEELQGKIEKFLSQSTTGWQRFDGEMATDAEKVNKELSELFTHLLKQKRLQTPQIVPDEIIATLQRLHDRPFTSLEEHEFLQKLEKSSKGADLLFSHQEIVSILSREIELLTRPEGSTYTALEQAILNLSSSLHEKGYHFVNFQSAEGRHPEGYHGEIKDGVMVLCADHTEVLDSQLEEVSQSVEKALEAISFQTGQEFSQIHEPLNVPDSPPLQIPPHGFYEVDSLIPGPDTSALLQKSNSPVGFPIGRAVEVQQAHQSQTPSPRRGGEYQSPSRETKPTNTPTETVSKRKNTGIPDISRGQDGATQNVEPSTQIKRSSEPVDISTHPRFVYVHDSQSLYVHPSSPSQTRETAETVIPARKVGKPATAKDTENNQGTTIPSSPADNDTKKHPSLQLPKTVAFVQSSRAPRRGNPSPRHITNEARPHFPVSQKLESDLDSNMPTPRTKALTKRTATIQAENVHNESLAITPTSSASETATAIVQNYITQPTRVIRRAAFNSDSPANETVHTNVVSIPVDSFTSSAESSVEYASETNDHTPSTSLSINTSSRPSSPSNERSSHTPSSPRRSSVRKNPKPSPDSPRTLNDRQSTQVSSKVEATQDISIGSKLTDAFEQAEQKQQTAEQTQQTVAQGASNNEVIATQSETVTKGSSHGTEVSAETKEKNKDSSETHYASDEGVSERVRVVQTATGPKTVVEHGRSQTSTHVRTQPQTKTHNESPEVEPSQTEQGTHEAGSAFSKQATQKVNQVTKDSASRLASSSQTSTKATPRGESLGIAIPTVSGIPQDPYNAKLMFLESFRNAHMAA